MSRPAREQGGELAQRLAGPGALGGDERVRLAVLQQPQRLPDAGTVPVVRGEGGLVQASRLTAVTIDDSQRPAQLGGEHG